MLAGRRLNGRDQRFRDHVMRDDGQRYAQDLQTDLTPANIQALGQAIDRTKDPRARALLLQELERLKDLASNLLGPIQPPPTPPQGVQLMPFDPQTQRPELTGGQRMLSFPQPGSM